MVAVADAVGEAPSPVPPQDAGRRRRSRYGPAPLPADALRTHCVSVRLAPAELAELDRQRGPYRRGEWLRMSWQRTLPPPPPPELNREAWAELACAAANLNQLAHHLNGLAVAGAGATADDVAEVARALAVFRAALIGAQASADDDEEAEP